MNSFFVRLIGLCLAAAISLPVAASPISKIQIASAHGGDQYMVVPSIWAVTDFGIWVTTDCAPRFMIKNPHSERSSRILFQGVSLMTRITMDLTESNIDQALALKLIVDPALKALQTDQAVAISSKSK